MSEPEFVLSVRCPLCGAESRTSYRASIIGTALLTDEMRFYAECHVTSWEASKAELLGLRELTAGTQAACSKP